MNILLDQAANVIRDAMEFSGERRSSKLNEAIGLLEAVKPTRERDGMMALAYLRLSQTQKEIGKKQDAERNFMVGYSYSRTSREERVRRLAEKMSSEYVVI